MKPLFTKSLLAVPFSALILFGSLSANAQGGMGEDLLKAPPAFTAAGKTVVPIDFQYVDLILEFDAAARKGTGHSKIEFFSKAEGYPMMDLVPAATSVRLNGTELGSAGLLNVSPPGNATTVRMVNGKVNALSRNTLELNYVLPDSIVSYAGGGVRMVWAMSDVGDDRAFLEEYAPSNLEFDQFKMDLTVTIKGATSKHRIFTNGRLEDTGSSEWYIDFPSYFTTSSFFFHITNKTMPVEDSMFQGLTQNIPITVYGDSVSSPATAMANAKKVLAENEAAYGPFPHDRLVIYLNDSGGGMEHCGATITSLDALGHELTHSWFARGVMPAAGNAGWVDEAIASWRDNGYPSTPQDLSGSAVNLAAFNVYSRTTPMAAYSKGARLLSGFDSLFPNGLKSVLREVFSRKQRETITTPQFEAMLKEFSGKNVGNYFKRYVYNNSQRLEGQTAGSRASEPNMISLHPRAFTRGEIGMLR